MEPDRTTRIAALAAGPGWRVSDIDCRSGPGDPAVEEAHERVAIAAVLAGSFAYRSGHGRALMSPGSILLGNQGAGFCCHHDHGVGDRCVAFHFDPQLIEETAAALPGARRTVFAQPRLPPLDALAPLLADIRALAAAPDPLAAEETALRLAGAALRLAQDSSRPRARLADERRMADAVARIARHHAEPLSLADLAADAGVGRYHFLRLFRQVVGTTPYQYMLTVRLAAAADRLRQGGGTVLDAALAAGFSDLSEFTRRFRDCFGAPPGRWRRS